MLKILGKKISKPIQQFNRNQDLKNGTFFWYNRFGKEILHRYVKALDFKNFHLFVKYNSLISRLILGHYFDLLGSGLVQVKYNMNCRGVEGHCYNNIKHMEIDSNGEWLENRINSSNIADSQAVWRFIYSRNAYERKSIHYIPIDWHRDFKSGFRWDENIWYKDDLGPSKAGVDIKVPWELARMQHLTQLAWAYGISIYIYNKPDFKIGRSFEEDAYKQPDSYLFEFKNQVLDFIACNPPRFGVNWRCTMDVAIRIVNWLVAFDIFRAYGAIFDDKFNQIFISSVYQHGQHIVNNLEWNNKQRNNHYLSAIGGLIFVAAYLPRNQESDAWLALGIQELIKEIGIQFYPEGSNFECSTSYHRLSAEIIAYSIAIVMGLTDDKKQGLEIYNHHFIKHKPRLKPAPLRFYPLAVKSIKDVNGNELSPFPEWLFSRLEKMSEFVMHITKHNFCIPQVGDNDSGRFLKIQPSINLMSFKETKEYYYHLSDYSFPFNHQLYLDENILDHRHLVSAINGFFKRKDFNNFTSQNWIEEKLISDIINNKKIKSYKDHELCGPKFRNRRIMNYKTGQEIFDQNSSKEIYRYIFFGHDLVLGLKCFAYPYFGLYIYRSPQLYLSIYCPTEFKKKNLAHAHNDELTIELSIGGKDILSDPGTYLYSPIPSKRNNYRSIEAHFTPQFIENEPSNLDQGLFRLNKDCTCKVRFYGENSFYGTIESNNWKLSRQVKIESDCIKIEDVCHKKNQGLIFKKLKNDNGLRYSNGYGKLLNSCNYNY